MLKQAPLRRGKFGTSLIHSFMKKIIFIFSILLIVGAGCSSSNQANLNEAQEVNKEIVQENLLDAPDFELKDYDGNIVKLSDFNGKPIVINSWAVWCPFCKQELVDFTLAKREFGDKIEFIAIDRAESLSKAKKYTDSAGVTNELIFLLDPKDSFYRSIGGFTMPETIFVNAEGKIQFHKRGPMKIEEIREKVENLLNID